MAAEVNGAASRSRASPRVVAVWITLALLSGVILAVERGSLFAPERPQPTGRLPMFDFTESDLGAVQMLFRGKQATLMRDDAGAWFAHDGAHSHAGPASAQTRQRVSSGDELHGASAKDASKIAEGLSASARMLADRRIEPDGGLDKYGLENPQAMFVFYGRANGGKGAQAASISPLAVLQVGDLLTTDFAYYTLRKGDREISLLPRYQNSLLLTLAFGEAVAPTPIPAQDASQ